MNTEHIVVIAILQLNYLTNADPVSRFKDWLVRIIRISAVVKSIFHMGLSILKEFNPEPIKNSEQQTMNIEQTITREEMTEALYLRAEEIFLLCAIITRRGIAHAFCGLDAHVGKLDSRVMAVDQVYDAGVPHVRIVELNVPLEMYDWLTGDKLTERFEETMAEMDTYVTYLDLLIAKNTPVRGEMLESVA